jgi:hypothetical protein
LINMRGLSRRAALVTGRRALAGVVVAIAVGAGLVLVGASRTWWVETVPQPAPLRPQEVIHTGASLAPVLSALGFVALAGAGGLLATRGGARRLVGGLLVAAAVGVVALVIPILAGGDPVGLGGPTACVIGALLVAGAGVLAAREGGRWPVMGRRYGRGASGVSPAPPATSTAPPTGSTSGTGGSAAESAELWDALDRGEDPTRR